MKNLINFDITTLIAQMSDEELKQAYKELALDAAYWHKKNKKRYIQLSMWYGFIIDEMWHRNHHIT